MEAALRNIGKGAAHRGQDAPNSPMPRSCACFRTKKKPTSIAAMHISRDVAACSKSNSPSLKCLSALRRFFGSHISLPGHRLLPAWQESARLAMEKRLSVAYSSTVVSDHAALHPRKK